MLKEIIDNFLEVVTKRYFCFEGKADEKEFWYFLAVVVVVNIVLLVIPVNIIRWLASVWVLAMLCPLAGVIVRRINAVKKN